MPGGGTKVPYPPSVIHPIVDLVNHCLLAIVIDDDPSVCRALRRLLQAAGIEVETYASADDFLQAALRREPDCLVLDVRMPGMTGPQLRDHLHSAGRLIPVVFITAHAEEGHGDPWGATILRKPFDGQALLDAIHETVRHGTKGQWSSDPTGA